MPGTGSEQASSGSSVDTVVRKCTGYRLFVQSGILYFVLLLTTVLLSTVAPRLSIWLLLLKCPLNKAVFVHVKLRNGKQHLVRITTLSAARLPSKQQSQSQLATKGRKPLFRVFRLSAQLYIFNTDLSAFLPLEDMPRDMPQQIWSAVQALAGINQGAEWTTFNVPTSWPRRDRCTVYGLNDLQLAKPHFFPIYLQTLSFILFLVQYGELVFAIWNGRQVFHAIMAGITMAACLRTTVRTYRNRRMLLRVLDQQCVVPFVWVGRVLALSSRRVVPGDVVVLQRGKATCDMVLLRGAGLVEESMLSGEAAQVRKHSYKADNSMAAAKYHPDTHQTCSIFAGTVVHQVWNDEDADDEVLAMVVRTGCNSTIGNMLRRAIRPSHFLSATDSLVKDIFGIYLFTFVINFALYIPTTTTHPRSSDLRFSPEFRFLDTVVMSMPACVPAVIIFAIVVGLQRLRWKGIIALYPGQLKLAAAVDIACFDKTGTLTGSEVLRYEALPAESVPIQEGYFGVLPVSKGQIGTLQKFGMGWSRNLKFVGAACNGLVMKGKNNVIGDALEKQLFHAVEAQYVGKNTVVLPHKASRKQDVSCPIKLNVIKRFEFTSQAMKSGAVVVPEDAPEGTALLLVKGAPNVIKHMTRTGNIPENYDRVVDDWSSRSFRLLALAAGTIKNFKHLERTTLTMQQAEAAVTHMSLVGLLVVTNALRADSKDTIAELQDDGGIRTIMCTGDYHQTAVAVAWGVGMVPAGGVVHVIDKLPASAVVSPPSSPVQIASSNSLFPRELDGILQQPYQAWSSLRPKPQGVKLDPLLSDPAEVSRDALLAEVQHPAAAEPRNATRRQTAQSRGSPRGSRETERTADVSPLARFRSTLQVTTSLDSSQESSQGLLSQNSADFRLQCDGQRFFLGTGDIRLDSEATRALTTIAEGQAQCAVTGAAFEHLLQQEDLAVLEAVLQNALVFARMRPYQKAQVMSLLGTAGLHQVFRGRHRHIPGQQQTVMFCGDGLNDLAALGTAEVGLAIGPINAMAAAPFSTRNSSIAGTVVLIKEARGVVIRLLALIKYMIVYQLVQSVAQSFVMIVSGVLISQTQMGMIDVQAMVWAFVAAWTPINPRLSLVKPNLKLCSKRIMVPIIEVVVLATVTLGACYFLMKSTDWYEQGEASASASLQNPVVTLAWSVANFVLQGQIMGFKVDTWPHCLGPTSNPPLIAVTLIIIFFAHFFVAANFLFTHQPLSLYRFPTGFRNEFWGILLGAAAFFVIARVAKQVVQRKQQERIQAELRSSGASRLSTAGGSLGSGATVTTLPSTRGSTGSATLNERVAQSQEHRSTFQRFIKRAPKIAPLVPGLSSGMTHADSQSGNTVVLAPNAEASPESSAQPADERV